MNSRERVIRSIEFTGPDRLPMDKGEWVDIAGVGYRPAADFQPETPGLNEWGYAFTSLNETDGDQGQVLQHPLGNWENFAHYRFPNPDAPGRFTGLVDRIEQLHDEGLFVRAALGKGPMHLLDDLRGFEAYLMDLMTEPERIELLLDGIFRFLNGLAEKVGKLGADGMHIADDQAMQTGPIFSMDIWRELFKPRYREFCDLAHELGCKVFMHTCGDLSEHLCELVDAGVDVIDNKQPALWMDSPAVDDVRERVCSSTCIDIQSIMPSIGIGEIKEEVGRLVQRLSTPRGGFIGTFYGKPDLSIPPEKNAEMVEAMEHFRY